MTASWPSRWLCVLFALTFDLPVFAQSTADDFLKTGIAMKSNGLFMQADFYLTRAIEIDPKLAAPYYHRGMARESGSSADLAIADYTRAIELDPNLVDAYYRRAAARQFSDPDGAIADYTRVTELNPKHSHAYFARGRIKEAKRNLEGSVTDYTLAIETDTDKYNSGLYHCFRGNIKKERMDLDGAIADYSKAIEVPGHNTFYGGTADSRFGRGSALYMKHTWKEALSDFHLAAEICRNRPTFQASLHFWLVAVRMGQKEVADKELAESMAKASAGKYLDNWTEKVARLLLGQIVEADLLAYAGTIDARQESGCTCRSLYYVGIKRLLAGDRDGAVDCFKKSVAMILKYRPEERLWAESELKNIGID